MKDKKKFLTNSRKKLQFPFFFVWENKYRSLLYFNKD